MTLHQCGHVAVACTAKQITGEMKLPVGLIEGIKNQPTQAESA